MELKFIKGTIIRKVYIKDKVATLITPENNFMPIRLDLNIMKEQIDKLKDSQTNKEEIETLMKFNSEQDLADDIIKDFKSLGWRLISSL